LLTNDDFCVACELGRSITRGFVACGVFAIVNEDLSLVLYPRPNPFARVVGLL